MNFIFLYSTLSLLTTSLNASQMINLMCEISSKKNTYTGEILYPPNKGSNYIGFIGFERKNLIYVSSRKVEFDYVGTEMIANMKTDIYETKNGMTLLHYKDYDFLTLMIWKKKMRIEYSNCETMPLE